MQLPHAVLKAKEQAAEFGRRVALFRSLYRESSPEAGEQLRRFLEEFGCNTSTGWQRGWHPLTTVVDLSLRWAITSTPPRIDALRDARSILGAASAEWASAWTSLAWLVKDWGLERTLSDAINDSATMAEAERLRVDATLAERWPVVSEEEEQESLAAMKNGAFVELDEAFAGLAGVTKEVWDARVEEHKRKRLHVPNRE